MSYFPKMAHLAIAILWVPFCTFARSETAVKVDDRSLSYISYYATQNGQWLIDNFTDCYKGTRHYTASAGVYDQFTFSGSSIKWIGEKDVTRGFADIYIDGVLDTTIDTYAPQIAYQQVLYQKNGLLDDRHILKVVCKGIKNPWATNIGIDFDAFEFSGDTLPAPLVNYSD
jgi:hypothetical protein